MAETIVDVPHAMVILSMVVLSGFMVLVFICALIRLAFYMAGRQMEREYESKTVRSLSRTAETNPNHSATERNS